MRPLRLLLGLCLLPEALSASGTKRSNERGISIRNASKTRVEIRWVNQDNGETHLMSTPDVAPGADFTLNSFVGHQFLIQELPGKNGRCKAKPCRKLDLIVSENDEQFAEITPEFQLQFVDNRIKAQEEASSLIDACKIRAKSIMAQNASLALEQLVDCVQGGVARKLATVNEEIAFQASVRTDIAGMLENYTCLDSTLESSPDVETKQWHHKAEPGIVRTVHVKHERPSSKIHVVEHFIRPDECQAMEEAAATKLHRASVADGKGGSKLSENRKAMQAGIDVPWEEEANDHPIARISRRVYDYANHVLGLNIQHNGQEALMSIQYFGRGANDTEPDRYTPHCDGDCTGLPHKEGQRMATMVVYCETADQGGHTNFRNSGVHIKPEPFAGLFFSYMDPETMRMDTGFTEHSGCPVFEGQKKIVTQWIRLGVDDDNPWDSFNTLGIKKSELEEYEYDEDGEYDDEDDMQEDTDDTKREL